MFCRAERRPFATPIRPGTDVSTAHHMVDREKQLIARAKDLGIYDPLASGSSAVPPAPRHPGPRRGSHFGIRLALMSL